MLGPWDSGLSLKITGKRVLDFYQGNDVIESMFLRHTEKTDCEKPGLLVGGEWVVRRLIHLLDFVEDLL